MNRQDDLTLPAERALHDQMNILPRGKLLIVFATLSVTLFISFIDQNGISVMLPTIARDLESTDTISWAGTASLIGNTTFQMLYGRLSDIFGRKAVYIGAIASLVLADLLCGLVNSAPAFYAFRGLAGVGGGGIANLSMIIISDIVTLEERGKYQGIIGATVGLSNVLGPFLAAAFIERLGNWRAFFYLLAPLGAASGIIAFICLPSIPRPGTMKEGLAKIDYAGSLTSSLAVIFLLIPISGAIIVAWLLKSRLGGSYFAWNSPMVISMLFIGAVSLVLFLIVEWKLAKLPMMPISIFNRIPVTVMLIQSFLFGWVYQSYVYYVPLYLQNARGFSVITTAAISIALVGTQTVTSILSGQYISTFRRYGEVIWVGFGLWTLGSGLTLIYTRDSSPGVIVGPLLIAGFGVGCVFQPVLVALQAHSPKARRAVIISNRNFFRCAGGACGLAVSAAVLQSTFRATLPNEYAYLANNTYSLPSVEGLDASMLLDAYMAASRAVFIVQVPLISLCLLGCALIKDQGLELAEDKQVEDETTTDENSEKAENRVSATMLTDLRRSADISSKDGRDN